MVCHTAPKLCVIPGDGIGREVVPAAVDVLQALIPGLVLVEAEAGWDCFLRHGRSVPRETVDAVRDCGAALFGAVSSPSGPVPGYRSAIVTMRRELDLYANIRPVHSLPQVAAQRAVDMVIVRENSEGLYSGRERRTGEVAVAERIVTVRASRRVARIAFEVARRANRRRLTLVHKANVLPVTDGLFRDEAKQVVTSLNSREFTLEVDELLADTAMLEMVRNPERFDVLLTTNLFGDLLSDAAAHWGGGIGLAPSINLGDGLAIAEPVHGSAPDIAGQELANPIAAIRSAALLARYVWGMEEVAGAIERAIVTALNNDPDLLRPAPGLTRRVLDAIRGHLTGNLLSLSKPISSAE